MVSSPMHMCRLWLTTALLSCTAGGTSPGGIPLTGYICPSCPSVTNPAAVLADLHTQYSTVIFAFATFE